MELLTGSPRRRIDPCPTIDQLDCGEPLWLVNSRPDRQRDKRWHSSIELEYRSDGFDHCRCWYTVKKNVFYLYVKTRITVTRTLFMYAAEKPWHMRPDISSTYQDGSNHQTLHVVEVDKSCGLNQQCSQWRTCLLMLDWKPFLLNFSPSDFQAKKNPEKVKGHNSLSKTRKIGSSIRCSGQEQCRSVKWVE